MSKNFVHAGKRLRVLAAADHKAGDLVYEKGWFGVVQDDVVSGNYFTLILEGVWLLARVPSTLAMGAVVAAGPSSVATTLVLLAWNANVGTTAATAAMVPIGKAIATGNATVAKIRLMDDYPA